MILYNTSSDRCDSSDSIKISDSSDNSEKSKEEKIFMKTIIKKKKNYIKFFVVNLVGGNKL